MKTIITIAMYMALALFTPLLNAQNEDSTNKIRRLQEQKKHIVMYERQALKKEVETINEKLSNNEITREEARDLKETAAKNHALNIENGISIIDNRIALLERNGSETIGTSNNKITFGAGAEDEDNTIFGINIKKKEKYDIRTYTGVVVAFGVNNVIVEGQSLEDSDYKIAGSRFFELGWFWKTRVFRKTNFLRVKYGISYQSNGLKPTGNRYFVQNGNQTELQEFGLALDKSKFRMDNIVIPVHLEFGLSEVKEEEEQIRYHTARKFRIGLGGYLGTNVSTRQKLKYKQNGDRIKDKTKRDYNTNDLIYGLSTYIGFGDISIYGKYDFSQIFKNAVVKQNNVSLGLRFDL